MVSIVSIISHMIVKLSMLYMNFRLQLINSILYSISFSILYIIINVIIEMCNIFQGIKGYDFGSLMFINVLFLIPITIINMIIDYILSFIFMKHSHSSCCNNNLYNIACIIKNFLHIVLIIVIMRPLN